MNLSWLKWSLKLHCMCVVTGFGPNLTLPAGEYVILHLVFLQPIRFWRKYDVTAPPAQRTPVAAADWSHRWQTGIYPPS